MAISAVCERPCFAWLREPSTKVCRHQCRNHGPSPRSMDAASLFCRMHRTRRRLGMVIGAFDAETTDPGHRHHALFPADVITGSRASRTILLLHQLGTMHGDDV